MLLGEGMASGEVIPLPCTAFRADAVEDAFQHLMPGVIPWTASLSWWLCDKHCTPVVLLLAMCMFFHHVD